MSREIRDWLEIFELQITWKNSNIPWGPQENNWTKFGGWECSGYKVEVENVNSLRHTDGWTDRHISIGKAYLIT